ncbi:MAG: hypothetical protein M9894_02955 [Planctomycetes bacterium]|nr:hypothetical protein [Planctomycetota bacterium]
MPGEGARRPLRQLDPGRALAWAERALLRQQEADGQGAVADARRALELAPREAQTLELLAAALAPLGQDARVLPHVEAALRVEPRPDVRARLERLAARLRGR